MRHRRCIIILFDLVFHPFKFNSYHWLFVCLFFFLTFEVHTRCFPAICFTRLDDVLVYGLWNTVDIGWDCMKNIVSCWYTKLNLRSISMLNIVKLIERIFEKEAISSFLLLNSIPWTVGKAYSFVKLRFSFLTGILAVILSIVKGHIKTYSFYFYFLPSVFMLPGFGAESIECSTGWDGEGKTRRENTVLNLIKLVFLF